MNYVCLDEDAISDPKGIRVRPVEGKEGVAYLEIGPFASAFSFVLGPLIEELEELGYKSGENLIPIPVNNNIIKSYLFIEYL